jgi:lipopolysaccharide/colanic/teichoic acid biosynthesis glycosyltransferase
MDALPRWKRSLDMVCIVTALPVLMPLAGLLILYIKLVSPGPLLFRQERIGYQKKPFICLKFRTMFVGAETRVHEEYCRQVIKEGAPMAKLDVQTDRRIIPGGRILRVLGLDELPQLINVWHREMSLVGPRPCLPNEFDRRSPGQCQRLEVLPGLTGWWQVRGKNATTFNRMIELDLEYLRRRSLGFDCRILLRTPAVILAECAGRIRRRLERGNQTHAALRRDDPSAKARA